MTCNASPIRSSLGSHPLSTLLPSSHREIPVTLLLDILLFLSDSQLFLKWVRSSSVRLASSAVIWSFLTFPASALAPVLHTPAIPPTTHPGWPGFWALCQVVPPGHHCSSSSPLPSALRVEFQVIFLR